MDTQSQKASQNLTAKSSQLVWDVMVGGDSEDWLRAFCADGDGLVQLVEYADRFEMLDQAETVKIFAKDDSLPEMLELSQSYLAATYNAIFQEMRAI